MGSRVILNFLLNEKPTDLHVRTHAFYFLKHLQKKKGDFCRRCDRRKDFYIKL